MRSRKNMSRPYASLFRPVALNSAIFPFSYQAVLNPGYSGEENPANGGGIRFGVNFRLMQSLRSPARGRHRRFSRDFLEPSAQGDGNLAFTIRVECSAARRD
jgi:hypothetical protein